MTKPLPSKVKAQREATRKREAVKLSMAKKRLEKDRQIRQRRLEIDERRRMLREQRYRVDNLRQERAEQLKKERQTQLQKSLDERLQKKKRFGTEKVGTKKRKGATFYKKKLNVRGRGVTLSRLLGG